MLNFNGDEVEHHGRKTGVRRAMEVIEIDGANEKCQVVHIRAHIADAIVLTSLKSSDETITA